MPPVPMSNYSQFFLSSGSGVVQLELIDIYHPNFSKRYRIVRNAMNGVTVTLEDSTVATFDYYPVKLTPTGSNNDLDQTLQLQFGDLGEILPSELDRIVVKPSLIIPNHCACIGCFLDGAGNVISGPFLIGNGIVIYVPQNAVSLGVGVNESGNYADNVGNWNISIDGATPVPIYGYMAPWQYIAGTKNVAYPYTNIGVLGTGVVPVTAGTLSVISLTGTVGLTPLSPQFDGFGNPDQPGIANMPGSLIPHDPNPGSYIKPTILYRTYRSDDLSQPLSGPHRFQVDNIAFQKEGAIFQCTAARLNLSATGEIYTMDRFPMLRGFL